MNHAETLLRASLEKYRNCASYSDAGTVRRSNSTNFITFETNYTRPNLFSFQWINQSEFSEPRKNQIWISNGSAYAKYDFQNDQCQVANLIEEIENAAGISSGATVAVVPLLLNAKNTECCRLQNLEQVKELPVEYIGNQSCHCIVGSVINEDDTQIWLSANDLTVRRIREVVLVSQKAHDEAVKRIESLVKTFMPPIKHVDQYHVDYDFTQSNFNTPP